jgi:SAM-dependent methyltransferase
MNGFENRASAYVASEVHRAGADLDQIESALRGQSFARVLDIGCGGGHVSLRAAPHVREVVAVDVAASMLDAVARTAAERGLANISVREAAAEALPFEAGTFDVVLSRFSAHHWSGFEAGLREARRVLKPAGRAMFVDTVAPGAPGLDTHLQAVELLRDGSHVRSHRVGEWVAALERAGFTVTGVTTRRLRMEFGDWIAASADHAAAIRSLQQGAPATARTYFGIGEDGSFDLDTATFEARC